VDKVTVAFKAFYESIYLLTYSYFTNTAVLVAALHQGAPGQMIWLEDPPPWLMTWLKKGRQLFEKKCIQ